VYNPGELITGLALIAIFASSLFYVLLNFKQESRGARTAARVSFAGFTVFVTLASMLLMHYILNHDYRYSYVARYSSTDLPLQYLISAFWAGQEGSFLLWVLLGSWLGILLMFKARDLEPQVMLVFNLNNIFLTILLIKQSPFEQLVFAPPDGQGLNMLLQDPWMVIHPPVVFVGYAAFAIPFAYAVAGLWRRQYDTWVRRALPWAVFAFVTLGAGIIIGGYWSYKVLGWGGYWGWDPVENASLLPWLAGTALVHGMILQETKKKLRKTNFVLAAFSFILVIYCTFLTRSGVLADFSVHSFVDLGITGWLVLFMLVFTVVSLWVLVVRAKGVPVSGKGEPWSYFSREFGLVTAIILLCLSTVIIGLGTSAPLITRMMEKASKVSTEFYVNTNLPIAVAVLFLLSFVPLLTWGRNSVSRLLPKLTWGVGGAIVAVAVTLIHGYPGLEVLLISIFGGAAVGMNLLLMARLMRKKLTLSAGAMVHFGVGLMFLGIVASSAYDRSEKVLLPQGQMRSAMGYDIKFKGPEFSPEGKGLRARLPLDVTQGDAQFTAWPDIFSEQGRGGQPKRFSHPEIRRGLVSDLYISPVDFDPGRKKTGPANQIRLKKGETARIHDYELTFTGFDVSGMMGREGSHDMKVGADIAVSYKGSEPVVLKPVITVGQLHGPTSRVKLPGSEDATLTLVNIEADAKTVGVVYDGPGASANEETEATPASVIAEVSIKPGMTVLWLGTFLILLGGSIGIVRHWPK
jgi:cytochrome c-type biogenesis protein CcmF